MCRTSGATSTPRARERVEHAAAERPAGARHLGAARLEREDRLVVGERPGSRRRGGSGSARRGGRGRRASGSGSVEPRDPQPRPPQVRRRAAGASPPPGSASRSPARPPRYGASSRRAARRPSARRRRRRRARQRASRDAAREPSPRRRASAAGSVADVLTTSRSPGCEEIGEVGEAVRARAPVARRDEQAHARRAPARRLGAPPAAREARTRAPRSCRRHRARAGSARSAQSPSTSASRPGTLVLGRRPVGDVLARERLLVHLRAHVAGVDGEDPQVRMLGGEDARELLERRLRRAVAAPALVRLDRGVGGDVDARTAPGVQPRRARAGTAPAARAR